MITASQLPRLMACPGALVLPRAENYSEWATLGNEAHDDLSDLETLPPEVAKHVPAGALAEVKLAYDVISQAGRIIGAGAGRSYGTPGPYEIVGSADVVGQLGDTVVVVDWKTGFRDVEPAATNAQLWFYALAALAALEALARAAGTPPPTRATVRIVYTQFGRLDEHDIEAYDFADFRVQLQELFVREAEMRDRRNATGAVETREGSWCRYCPSKHVCPSKNGALVQLATGGLAVIGDAEMSPDRAAEAVRQFLTIEAMVKDARARLVSYVNERGPIDLGDGTAYGAHVRDGDERISDVEIAVQSIRAIVGGDKERVQAFEAVAIERKTSKAALTRAAKAIGEQPRLATAIVNRIRDAGGIERGAEKRPIGVHPIAKVERAPLDVPYEEINRLLEAG